MVDNNPAPGVSRADRISDEGLQRLEKQLARGSKIARPVLAQWIKRYGDSARDIIRKYNFYSPDLD